MRKLIAVAALALAAACTASPTSTALKAGTDARPHFDSGVLGGSGNRSGGLTGTGIPGQTTSATGTEVTVTDSTNARGGVLGGSGN